MSFVLALVACRATGEADWQARAAFAARHAGLSGALRVPWKWFTDPGRQYDALTVMRHVSHERRLQDNTQISRRAGKGQDAVARRHAACAWPVGSGEIDRSSA